MSETEKPAARIRRWWLFPLLATVGAPFCLSFYDWAQAVRTARNSASTLAWTKAVGSFLGHEWPQPSIDGVTMIITQTPPQTGAFAGYAHATYVETVYEWQPIFHHVIGGPYVIHGRATAAVVRDESGKWMPITVE